MGLSISTYSKPIKYVPDVFGNRQSRDPFWVLIEPCSAYEYDAMGRDEFDNETMCAIIKARVKEVSGLTFELDDGRKFTPTTGEKLVAALEECRVDRPTRNDLVTNLAIAVLNHSKLKEGELDRFASQSA